MSFLSKENKERLLASCNELKKTVYLLYKKLFPQKHNAINFFISLVVAVFFWFNVETFEELDRVYEINIIYENIPDNIDLVEYPTSFNVILEGSSEELAMFENYYDELLVNYKLNVSNLTLGTNVYVINIEQFKNNTNRRAFRGLEVVAINPSHIVVITNEFAEQQQDLL